MSRPSSVIERLTPVTRLRLSPTWGWDVQAAGDRENAAADRARAASERAEIATDRKVAADDRAQAGQERDIAADLRDREADAHDEAAVEFDREVDLQAASDRQNAADDQCPGCCGTRGDRDGPHPGEQRPQGCGG